MCTGASVMTPAERANPASTSRVGDMLSSTIAATLADIHASAAPAAAAAAGGGDAAAGGTQADQQRTDEEPQQEQQGEEGAEEGEKLVGLKVNALLQRAQAAGVDEGLLDDAMVRS
eukprot:COSAG06_NODE_711_length_12877_cov_16.318281_8_plen_116_part_00